MQLLNKRRRAFTKEDEEFLSEVGTHAALAVEGVRQHEGAVARARREGAHEVIRGAQFALAPHEWPSTPGFETAPLRWRSDDLHLVAYAVEARPEAVAFLIAETSATSEESLGTLLKALAAGRSRLGASPSDAVERALSAGPSVLAAAARWGKESLLLAAGGPGSSVPYLLREGFPVPFPVSERARFARRPSRRRTGDLLVLASAGLGEMRFPGKPVPPEKSIQHFARTTAGQTLPGAFAQLVAEWKRMDVSVGPRDVLFLAARRSTRA